MATQFLPHPREVPSYLGELEAEYLSSITFLSPPRRNLILEKMKHFLRWRRNIYLQNARHYSPSSRYQASKVPPQSRPNPPKVSPTPQTSEPSPKPHCSRHVIPPPVPSNSQPNSSHDPPTPQKTGFRGPYPNLRSRNWAQNHRYVVCALVILGCGTVVFDCGSQRVPITGRRQLDYIPRWLEAWIENRSRKERDEWRKDILKCSWGSEHPDMQGPIAIFDRLLHAAGLDDGQWEFRVIQAPGK